MDQDGDSNSGETEQDQFVTVIQLNDKPDLIVQSIAVPADLVVGNPAQVQISWTVRNTAMVPTSLTPWIDRVVFSRDTLPGNGDDEMVADVVHAGGLPADGTYSETRLVTLPGNLVGNYFLFVQTDAAFAITERNEENNSSGTAMVSVTKPFADLVVEAVAVPAIAQSGDPIVVAWRVRNLGVAAPDTDVWVDRVVLSADDVLDASDTELGRTTHTGSLPTGANYTNSTSMTLPDGISGSFHIFVQTDLGASVFEFQHDTNNTGRSVQPVAVNEKASPDLRITALTGPIAGQPGQSAVINWTVENSGPGDANAPWLDRVYLTLDGSLATTTPVAVLLHSSNVPAAGGSYNGSAAVQLPNVVDGEYYFVVVTDEQNTVFEKNAEDNNRFTSSVPIRIGRPDLVPVFVNSPHSAISGENISIEWKVTNQGTARAQEAWVDRVFLSQDAALDAADVPLVELAHSEPLEPGTDYVAAANAVLPIDLSGSRFLLVRSDAIDQVHEPGGESNNSAAAAVEIQLAPFADLAVSSVSAPAIAIGDPASAQFEWTITNVGNGLGRISSWVDRVIASSDLVIGNEDDHVLAQVTHDSALDINTSYSEARTITLPPFLQGRFHLFVQTDATGAVFENDSEANNLGKAASAIDVLTIPFADLVVRSVIAPAIGDSGEPIEVSWEVTNQGIGTTNTSQWSDSLLLVRDPGQSPTGDNLIAPLAEFVHTGPLAVGSAYSRSAIVALPHGLEGSFFVVVATGFGISPIDGRTLVGHGPFEYLFAADNLAASDELVVTLTPPPDLVVSDIAAPLTALAGSRIDISWTVLNDGTTDADGRWVDRVMLREAGKPDGTSIELGQFTYSSPLQAGKFYTRSEQFSLPSTLQGLFQVVVTTNSTASLFEHHLATNNTTADTEPVLVTLAPRPDLQVLSVTAPATVSAGNITAIEFVVINQGTAATPSRWQDRVYISLDDRRTADDLLVATLDNGASLASAEQYLSKTADFVVPRRYRGEAFIIVQTDSGNHVDEFPNDDNNQVVVPVNVTAAPPADLVASHVVAPDLAYDGTELEVHYRVSNLGVGETDRDSWTDQIWLARDRRRPSPLRINPDGSQFGKGDILLATVTHSGSVALNAHYDQVVRVRLPERITGEYFITAWSDAFDVVLEDTLATNINPDDPNELDGNNYKARPISVLLTPPPDLTVTQVNASNGDQGAGHAFVGGEPITVRWTVTNQGNNETFSDRWTDRVYLSDSPVVGQGTRQWLLGDLPHTGTLGVGQSYTAEATFLLSPAASGEFVIVETNPGHTTFEGQLTNNNSLAASVSVTAMPPADLVVTSIVVPEHNFSGEIAHVEWSVQNRGATIWDGTRFWIDRVYLTRDELFNPDRVISSREFAVAIDHPLAPGESYSMTGQVSVPAGIEGTFFVHVATDVGGTTSQPGILSNDESRTYFETHVFENAANNGFVAPTPVTYREPDLVVSNIVVPSTPPGSGQSTAITYTVTNQGGRAAQSLWYDRAYLSRDSSLDEDDQFIGEFRRYSEVAPFPPLMPGESYTQTIDAILPEGIQGSFYVLLFTDSNITGALPPGRPGISGEIDPFTGRPVDGFLARIAEFRDEANNIAAEPLSIVLTPAPDLQVTSLIIPDRVIAGQTLALTYTVTNVGQGATHSRSPAWDDLIYLSRDQFLDLNADRFIGSTRHNNGLATGASYDVTRSLRLPSNLTGPFFVFVIADPVRTTWPRGAVFEGANEENNASTTQTPLLIELPPPSDLQVDAIVVPPSARSGDMISVSWTVSNHGDFPASGTWSDALYLSDDAVWDINDRPLGRLERSATLQPPIAAGDMGDSYSGSIQLKLPPVRPGSYRIIVRPDIFNEVFEQEGELNNRTASADSLAVTVDTIQLGIPHSSTLSAGESRVFQVTVGNGQTLEVSLITPATTAANELFVRFDDVPTGVVFDAASTGLVPNQRVVIATTQPGNYYVLVRGHTEPSANTPVTILADILPFQITDVTPDAGGDSRYVTMTIHGAGFVTGSASSRSRVKLIRPGIAEIDPADYEVIDGTRIVATFDLRGAPHGLYDLKVTNPDGGESVVPYRYACSPPGPSAPMAYRCRA
jgi:subtilase family serine protease